MNGAESLISTLVGAGVNVCFANPGTSEMHFVAALDRRQEQRLEEKQRVYTQLANDILAELASQEGGSAAATSAAAPIATPSRMKQRFVTWQGWCGRWESNPHFLTESGF